MTIRAALTAGVALALLGAVNAPAQTNICRPPGFFGVHAGTERAQSRNITQALLDAYNDASDGRQLAICGRPIQNTELGSASSAVEALCVSARNDARLELARQLTAAALGCILSNSEGTATACSADPGAGQRADVCEGRGVELVFAACNAACAAGGTTANVGGASVSCVAAVDCYNNGGSFDIASGQCEGAGRTCEVAALEKGCFHYQPPGPDGSQQKCRDARKNTITIFASP